MDKKLLPKETINLTPHKNILPPDKKHLWNRYPIDPDRELLEWERWVKIRSDEITVLEKNTTKPPPDLVMNMHENRREIQEWKTVLEHAQIQKKAKIRDHTLWEQPERLPQECCTDQVYEVHRTLAEKGSPKIIKHVGVPNEILKQEKGIQGISERKSSKMLDADFKKYKKRREMELEENIRKVDPFKSQLSELMVRGHQPAPPPPPPPILPLISVTFYKHTQKFNTSYFAIRINKSLFFKSPPDQDISHLTDLKLKYNDPCFSWFYYFNTPISKAATGTMILENVGTVTVRYYWLKVKRDIPFIDEGNPEQVFFFNKNEDVISPGQTKVITFSFVSENPGIYSEYWEFCISNAVIFNNPNDKFLINLYGDSVENSNEVVNLILDTQFHMKSAKKRQFINEILNEIVEKTSFIPLQPNPYKKRILESEVFVLKNPICFYHQSEVGRLRTFFNEMKPDEEWDLSIVTWRSAMISLGFGDRMKYFELLKESHSDLLKPWYEEFDIEKQKQEAVKMLIGDFAKKMDDEHIKMQLLMFPPKVISKKSVPRTDIDMVPIEMKNIFYMKVYSLLSDMIEAAAGVISSLDLCRHIDFDFCKHQCHCDDNS